MDKRKQCSNSWQFANGPCVDCVREHGHAGPHACANAGNLPPGWVFFHPDVHRIPSRTAEPAVDGKLCGARLDDAVCDRKRGHDGLHTAPVSPPEYDADGEPYLVIWGRSSAKGSLK